MFGYITVDKPNMLFKDYAEYRAYYCGLCKSISKANPQLMRLTVNYDIVLLSLLAHNYAKLQPDAEMGRCIIHPVGKKFLILNHNEIQEKIVDINTILGYYKLEDDLIDEGKVRSKVAKSYIKRKYKRAAKRLPDFAEKMGKVFADFASLQRNKAHLSEFIEKSAEMLVLLGKESCKNYDAPLVEFCENLGRWIYLIDAYDDMWKDHDAKVFNPLIFGKELTTELVEEITIMVEANLKDYIKIMIDNYDIMDISISEGPLSNIIYLGLKAATDRVLANRGKKSKITLL